MKLKINKNWTVTISGLTATETDVILSVVNVADSRCFRLPEPDGIWYSGEDFVLSLTGEQRTALAKIGGEIRENFRK